MNPEFVLERYFVEGLAHASYLFGHDGVAVVVDPKRDVDGYLADASRLGLRIIAILETHPHADFVSGHVELAQRTGASIYVSHRATARYPHHAARNGDVLAVGAYEIATLETPGHSPDSISWLVRRDGAPVLVFSGDTLFVGDVGRPDLRDADEKPETLAGALYDSLFHVLLALPDTVRVYPAHGQGSLCGRKLGSAPFTTIGGERLGNWALQIHDRAEFVRRMTENLPARPAYFSHAVQANLDGAPALDTLPAPRALPEKKFAAAVRAGAVVIDTRGSAIFGAGHFPGSLNIGIASHLFSTWVGFFAPFGKPIVLVVETAAAASRARLELARIGYDHIAGYLKADSLAEMRQLSQLSVCDLRRELDSSQPPVVLDVRTVDEWKSGHIAGARHIPLPALTTRLSELPRDSALAVVCGSSYRSSIAACLLEQHGFTRLQNVMGGMSAFRETKCPGLPPAELVAQRD